MKKRKILWLSLLFTVCLALSGCRTRTTVPEGTADENPVQAEETNILLSGSRPEDTAEDSDQTDQTEKDEEPGEQTSNEGLTGDSME